MWHEIPVVTKSCVKANHIEMVQEIMHAVLQRFNPHRAKSFSLILSCVSQQNGAFFV